MPLQSSLYVPDITEDYEQEIKRFQSYPTDTNEFDAFLVQQLKSTYFLRNATVLLSGLWLQHELMKRLSFYNMMRTRIDQIENEIVDALGQLGEFKRFGEKTNITFSKVKTPEAMNFLLNKILVFTETFRRVDFISSDRIKQIATEILDTCSETNDEINMLLKSLLYRLDSTNFKQFYSKSFSNWLDRVTTERDLFFAVYSKNRDIFFINNNLSFLRQNRTLADRLATITGTPAATEESGIKLRQEINRLIALYEKVQPFYVNLYNKMAQAFERYLKKHNIPLEKIMRDDPDNFLKDIIKKCQEPCLPILTINDAGQLVPLPPVIKDFHFIQQPVKYVGKSMFEEFMSKKEKEKTFKQALRIESLRKKRLEKKERKAALKKASGADVTTIEPEEEELEEPADVQSRISEIFPDGSYAVENPCYETIKDPKNKITIHLFNPGISKKTTITLPIQYTQNVLDWFKDPNYALEQQGYLEPKAARYAGTKQKREEMIRLHSFALAADDFIKSYGIEASTPSRQKKGKQDILVMLSGMIETEDGQKLTGIFTYIFDGTTGVCYHRMFTPQ